MSLRVLFLTPWYPDDKMPHHGVFIRDQAEAVSKMHEVVVISSKVDYASFRLLSWRVHESVFGNVREYRLVVKRSLPFLNQINYLLISMWLACKVAKRFRPDIIHGNIAYPGAVWSYIVSRLSGCAFIVSDHTSRFVDNFRSPFHKALTLFSFRRAKHVIAVSTWAAENIRRVIGGNVEVVPNLIHVDAYSITDVPDSCVQIGFLGGLSTDRKGLDVLLKAMSGVRKDFRLHIGGQGKYLRHYQEMSSVLGIGGKCHFHGFVDYVPHFMSRLHFFVSSSHMEAFGMVIAEAMASGLPVVTTNSGGPADFMDASCGRMVPVADVDGLRDAIDWMIDHYKSFDRNLIRKKATDNFSAHAFLKRINMFYDSALQR